MTPTWLYTRAYRECLTLRKGGIPFYFTDWLHKVLHWLCNKPAYWLIWVISEENVTNLCRKCCNWISASRITWSSSQECTWKPQHSADRESKLFLEWSKYICKWVNILNTCVVYLAFPSWDLCLCGNRMFMFSYLFGLFVCSLINLIKYRPDIQPYGDLA